MSSIKLFIITVGVQYGHREDDPKHPLGIHSDEYMVIEAPDEGIARKIAFALMDREWSFIYEYGDGYDDAQLEHYHPGGERLRIAWIDDPESFEAMKASDMHIAADIAREQAIRTSSGFPVFDIPDEPSGHIDSDDEQGHPHLPSLDFAKPRGHDGEHLGTRL